MRRLFVHHDGALGDLLLSLPALALLREKWGGIHLAARADCGALLKEVGLAEEAYDAGSTFFTSLYHRDMDASLATFLNQFERAFVFSVSSQTHAAQAIRKVCATDIVLTIPQHEKVHAGVFRLRQVSGEGAGFLPVSLKIPKPMRTYVRSFLRKQDYKGQDLIILHPGSGGKRKCWPLDRFFSLIEALRQHYNAFFIILSGPVEEGSTESSIDEFVRTHENVSHLKNERLIIAASLISEGSLYIGNDSGITHLAAALRTKTIALFGPTDPLVWSPLGRRVRIIQSEVPCAPCSTERMKVCATQRCLSGITVERVLQEIS